MLSETVQRLISDNLATVKQLASLANVHTNTIYYWTSKGEPTADAMRRWIQTHPDRAVRAVLVDAITAGAATLQDPPADLDVNGDGSEDVEDAIDALIGTLARVTRALRRIREAVSDRSDHPGRICDDEGAPILRLLDQVHDATQIARTLVHRECQRDRRRRPANKHLRMAGGGA